MSATEKVTEHERFEKLAPKKRKIGPDLEPFSGAGLVAVKYSHDKLFRQNAI